MPESMRAVVITEPGGPEVMEIRSVPAPRPAPEEVVVEVVTSGVNRADLLQRRGGYAAPPGASQDVPGMEFSGRVAETGSAVTRWKVGDAVMGIVGGGGYAERLAVHQDVPMAVPEELSVDEAGAVPEVFLTAFDAVVMQEGLEAGETLLIHAVGSGVGTAALQLGLVMGARVIGTSRTAAKLELAAGFGLRDGILADNGWPERVLAVTEGQGADVILDLVGGPYMAGNQQVMAKRGRHIVVGVTGGAKTEFDLRALMMRRGSIRGTVLRSRALAEKVALVRAFEQRVLGGFARGELRPVLDRILPAESVVEAHRLLEDSATFGKLLLRW